MESTSKYLINSPSIGCQTKQLNIMGWISLYKYYNLMPSSSVSNHQLVDGGTFTNIKAIGIVTNVLFFMFLCQKLY
jgi:hypothetical protein